MLARTDCGHEDEGGEEEELIPVAPEVIGCRGKGLGTEPVSMDWSRAAMQLIDFRTDGTIMSHA